MGENSKIEWTHHTFNPWRGCTKVSDGCKHCYAETLSSRNPATLGVWGVQGQRAIAAESYWRQPIKWNRDAEAAGERRRVFCASLADVFEGPETMPAEAWPKIKRARVRLIELIYDTPYLDWLLLTKRPEGIIDRLHEVVREADEPVDLSVSLWLDGEPPPNVWLGTSVENQKAADERIAHLLGVPAAVRFLSCEPLLGPIDLWRAFGTEGARQTYIEQIDWVIVGGESGTNARPMHPDWARSLRDQCQSAGIPFFFKQWGEYIPTTEYRDGQQFMSRVGKKAAGRLLDGRIWHEQIRKWRDMNVVDVCRAMEGRR